MTGRRFEIGDLVTLHDSYDSTRSIGIITGMKPRQVHVVSHGSAYVYQVYWPLLQETDWEYEFFLKKYDDSLTEKSQ